MEHAIARLSEIDRLADGDGRVLVAMDFDGTLCPIVDPPSAAAVPAVITEVMHQLCSSPRVVVAVISGRALKDVMKRMPLCAVYAGNHGLEIRGSGLVFEHAEARRLRPQLAQACQVLARGVAGWKGAWVEDKTLTATVHYRNVPQADHQAVIRTVRQCMAGYGSLFGFRTGEKAVEIHPRVGWDKGACLTWIRRQLGLEGRPCLCIGDDPTDESMFAANPSGINIKVGSTTHTAAHFEVNNVSEVAVILTHLAQAMRTVGSHSGKSDSPARGPLVPLTRA